jgi:type I restriction enzyme S subunit
MVVKPGYKQTDIGAIPEDWAVAKIGEVVKDITVGFVGSMSHLFLKNGIPLLRGQNVLPNILNLSDTKFISRETHKQWKKSALQPGDVVLVRVGYPGTSCVIPENLGQANAASLVIIRPSEKKINPYYLSIVINSDFGKGQIENYLVGGAQQVLNIKTAAIFKLPLPTISEQKEIAKVFCDMNKLIKSLEQLIAKKRDIKQAAMQELLTGKKRLPGFNERWEAKDLGEIICKIVGGGTPSRAVKHYWGDDISWVTVKDFATFNPFHTQESITREGLQNSAANLIPSGTLIVSTRMALGKAVVYKTDVAINQDLKALYLKPFLSTEYLYYWFQCHSKSIEDLGSGSTVRGITLQDLKDIKVNFPPLPEQLAIVSTISDMDTEIATMCDRLAKTVQLKQGMMQELLTGRIRLV